MSISIYDDIYNHNTTDDIDMMINVEKIINTTEINSLKEVLMSEFAILCKNYQAKRRQNNYYKICNFLCILFIRILDNNDILFEVFKECYLMKQCKFNILKSLIKHFYLYNSSENVYINKLLDLVEYTEKNTNKHVKFLMNNIYDDIFYQNCFICFIVSDSINEVKSYFSNKSIHVKKSCIRDIIFEIIYNYMEQFNFYYDDCEKELYEYLFLTEDEMKERFFIDNNVHKNSSLINNIIDDIAKNSTYSKKIIKHTLLILYRNCLKLVDVSDFLDIPKCLHDANANCLEDYANQNSKIIYLTEICKSKGEYISIEIYLKMLTYNNYIHFNLSKKQKSLRKQLLNELHMQVHNNVKNNLFKDASLHDENDIERLKIYEINNVREMMMIHEYY